MDPEAVSSLQAGNFGNGERLAVPLHSDFDFWSDQIEGSGIGRRGERKEVRNS